jgi:tRNA-specific adenosine deaminase 1
MVDADAIAQSIIETFNRCERGKPTTRSNGMKEWTVLAGIVSIIGDVITPLVVTTGVKALPDSLIEKSQGRLLHDCHAEILSLRAFNRFIVDECGGVEESDLLYRCDGEYQFKLKEGIRFALYISEPPCGDSSLELLVDENETEWNQVTQLDGSVLRGRECYGKKGRVRTKPGRRDSPLTLSKSCSDKLALKQFTGLLNSLTSRFIDPRGFHIEYLVLHVDRAVDAALNRCFHTRLEIAATEAHWYHPITILKTNEHHEWERESTDQCPSNLSLVHIPGSLEESINNFVKEGFYSKKQLVRSRGESSISRKALLQKCKPYLQLDSSLTYTDVKKINSAYRQLKQLGQDALGSWNHTRKDDFDI